MAMVKQLILLAAATVTCFLQAVSAFPQPTYKRIPPTVVAGQAQGIFNSSAGLPFDGAKIDIINQTAFDWWYFDAVASDGSAHITVVFYNCGITTLGFRPILDGTNFILFTTKFANGTIYEQVIAGNDAVITTVGDGSSGYFDDTGCSWFGFPDMSKYVVQMNIPTLGIRGSITLQKTVRSQYPCDLSRPDVSEQLPGLVNIGWANAVPDSTAVVDFKIGDYDLNFKGYGYHDKNWGIATLPSAVYSWYWGHVHIGPYSIVYFDILNSDHRENICSYLAKGQEIISKTCTPGATVRPIGGNATFPPTASSDTLTGFQLDFPTNSGKFVAKLTGEYVWAPTLPSGGYTRWAGKAEGGFEGMLTYAGSAVYEWIRFMA